MFYQTEYSKEYTWKFGVKPVTAENQVTRESTNTETEPPKPATLSQSTQEPPQIHVNLESNMSKAAKDPDSPKLNDPITASVMHTSSSPKIELHSSIPILKPQKSSPVSPKSYGLEDTVATLPVTESLSSAAVPTVSVSSNAPVAPVTNPNESNPATTQERESSRVSPKTDNSTDLSMAESKGILKSTVNGGHIKIKKESVEQKEAEKQVKLQEPSLPASKPKKSENEQKGDGSHVANAVTQKASKPPKIVRQPFVPISKPDPIMSSFGFGNTNPSIPSNNLKTFNARAPLEEIYGETLNRNNRIKAFEANELYPPPRTNSAVSETLQKYLQVKQLVSSLAKQFQTEYSMQFLNWSQEKGTRRDYPAGLPCGVPPPKKTFYPKTEKKVPKESTSSSNGPPSPVDFVKIQSIYSSLKPAGVSNELSNYKEKRHYDLQRLTEGSKQLYDRARMGLLNKG